MDTLGFMELSSIAGGVEITDAMLKSANVDLIFAKASCPGKYYICIAGFVSDVKRAIAEGELIGEGFIVSSVVLSKIHPQVIKAINMSAMPEKVDAIGVMEFYSVTSSITAADRAVKAANVELIDVRLGTGIGGKGFVILTGDTSAVKNAVNAACSDQIDSGMLLNKVVIPKPRKELIESLF